MPVLHPFVGGTVGPIHGADFAIVNYDAAAIVPAKMMAMTAIDLLADGASAAQQIIAGHKPRLTKAQYLAMMEDLSK